MLSFQEVAQNPANPLPLKTKNIMEYLTPDNPLTPEEFNQLSPEMQAEYRKDLDPANWPT
jgi:hypothetical protein